MFLTRIRDRIDYKTSPAKCHLYPFSYCHATDADHLCSTTFSGGSGKAFVFCAKVKLFLLLFPVLLYVPAATAAGSSDILVSPVEFPCTVSNHHYLGDHFRDGGIEWRFQFFERVGRNRKPRQHVDRAR